MAGNANSGGQNRKPTQMKVLEGTYRKDRANPKEPKPKELKIPPAPTVKLNQWGMEEWKRTTINLIACQVLAVTDVSQLSALCYEWGEFVECGIEIKKVTAPDEDLSWADPEQRVRIMEVRYLCAKNLEKLRKEHLEAYSKLAQQFGLTPASRTRISVLKKEETDPLDDL